MFFDGEVIQDTESEGRELEPQMNAECGELLTTDKHG
jgi:hypothetical protein